MPEGAKRIKHSGSPFFIPLQGRRREEDPFQPRSSIFRPCFLPVLGAPRARNERWILETENMGGRGGADDGVEGHGARGSTDDYEVVNLAWVPVHARGHGRRSPLHHEDKNCLVALYTCFFSMFINYKSAMRGSINWWFRLLEMVLSFLFLFYNRIRFTRFVVKVSFSRFVREGTRDDDFDTCFRQSKSQSCFYYTLK